MNHPFDIRKLKLIDLMVALSVFAIVLMVAVPGYGNIALDTQRTIALNRMVTALNLARSEAMKRSKVVSVCKSDDGEYCNVSDDTTVWSQGWIVFVDKDADGFRKPDEAVLSIFQSPERVRNWRSDTHFQAAVTYKGNGFSHYNGQFTYCDRRGSRQARAIIVRQTGRPKLSYQARCS